jgi:hypothetical protein
MLTLFLLRAGAGPVMAECTTEHHTEQAESVNHSEHSHPTDAQTQSSSPGCDHQSHDGRGHTQLDCDLAAGCAASPVAIGPDQPLAAADVPGTGDTSFEARPQPRAILPASPPPKS